EGQFRLQGLPDARPVSLQVFDNLGRLIQEIDAVDFSSGSTDLDLSGLPPAVYHLMMRGSSGTAAQRVWIRK
ncbi:MAG: T9SS type A sorting domain-containing protein, partial [Bacteroidetes bacterium]|nr:T9SS type A sorting domain-containing protein [Bacteroidota bacterium]